MGRCIEGCDRHQKLLLSDGVDDYVSAENTGRSWKPCRTGSTACPTPCGVRGRTIEHVFGPIKDRMGRSHFKTKTLGKVSTEMGLHVLAYTIQRAIALLGPTRLIAAMQGCGSPALAIVDAFRFAAVVTQLR